MPHFLKKVKKPLSMKQRIIRMKGKGKGVVVLGSYNGTPYAPLSK
jgi:hypothetical protein